MLLDTSKPIPTELPLSMICFVIFVLAATFLDKSLTFAEISAIDATVVLIDVTSKRSIFRSNLITSFLFI